MDKAGPLRDLPEHDDDADRVAERRPATVSTVTYAVGALKLLDNGYEPLPLHVGKKRPIVVGWSTLTIDEARVEQWCTEFGDCGVGLRTGHLVGVDIDLLDADAAHQAMEITTARLGATMLRVGRWPKRLLLYRTMTPIPKHRVGKIEVLGIGQQFVAYGRHPDTGRAYDWPMGDNPLDVAFEDLPLVDETAIEALLVELAPLAGGSPSGSRRKPATTGQELVRDPEGLVTEGRDGWLSTIAFHAVHDALDRGEMLDGAALAALVWERFSETTDLARPKQDGRRSYDPRDASLKVSDKLRLNSTGCLPGRSLPVAEPLYAVPVDRVADARVELDRQLAIAMDSVAEYHQCGEGSDAPRIGIRATVGLGKSTAARRHIASLRGRLIEKALPHRILNFVPSLALADETVAAWNSLGIPAVALRGYEALDQISREPMCRDLTAVRAAIDAGYKIESSACYRSKKVHCPHFAGCAKQANRHAVAKAPIVVAAYDAMFSGFVRGEENFGLVLLDEACWQRSLDVVEGLTIETLPFLGLTGIAATRNRDAQGAKIADAIAARHRLSLALTAIPPGDVKADVLEGLGINAEFCRDALKAEQESLVRPYLSPGQAPDKRKIAVERSKRRGIGRRVIKLWSALAELLEGDSRAVSKVWLGPACGKEMQRPIRLYERKVMKAAIARLPLMHLDATLRPEIAQIVLPGLAVASVEAAAPHQHIRLISGSFGKSMLCPDPGAKPDERQRRANRLRECVDYVRWHALRHQDSRVLVITYKAIEAEFAGIANAEVAHFNAVAGLDSWGDVSALFLIGRPLPQSDDLAELAGAHFDRSVTGKYASLSVGLVTETGRKASIRAIRHSDASAETLRAAICDDEVMQALGRGRGINRGAQNPLEVHLMADVVLPVAYDNVTGWDTVCPDIVQRMLIGGLAVDSAADASKLHPDFFGSVAAAESAARRAPFNRQNPIGNIYRGMTVKSASYRLGGRGRGWQLASWIAGSADDARHRLEAAIGPVAEWTPQAN